MISRFSPVRFGSGNDQNMPGLGQAQQDRRQVSTDEIVASRTLSNDVFKHGGLTNDEAVNPGKIKSPQVSKTLRRIISQNSQRSQSPTGDQ